MTDYEYDFPSYNEVADIQVENLGALQSLMEEKWPQTNALIEVNYLEKLPMNTTSKTHRESAEARAAAAEEEEEEDEEEEEEDEEGDEEGDGEGEGEEGDDENEDEEDDDDEEEDDDSEVPDDSYKSLDIEDRYFMHNENLKKKYNEVEIDSFMKILNIKPITQW